MTASAPSRPLNRWWQIASFTLMGVFLLIIGLMLVRTQQGQVAVSELAPDFEVIGYADTALAGQRFRLSEARGQVVVVNFWASWCLPCRDEAADLETVWQLYRERGVVVVGVAWTDTERKSLEFITEYGQTYLNGPDLGTRAGQAYRIKGVPETYIVDPQGRLAWVKIGPTNLDELQAVIEPLLR